MSNMITIIRWFDLVQETLYFLFAFLKETVKTETDREDSMYSCKEQVKAWAAVVNIT